MATFTAPKGVAVAGTAIIAEEHNENWTYVKNWLQGVAGDTGNYPGVVQGTGGSVVGPLTVSGTVSLGTSDAMYLNSSQNNVIGLATGTSINGEIAGNWLFDLNYRAGVSGLSWMADVTTPADQAGNYSTQKHRYSVYSKRAGEGQTTEVGRPAAEYRLVIDGSMAIRGDIIGYTNWNDDSGSYELGEGTRINCQWLNVRANIDTGGDIRVNTRYDFARLFMGNDYNATPPADGEDWLEWNDNIHSNQAGFGFHIHGSSATPESGRILSITKDSNDYIDIRAPIQTDVGGSTLAGWPTISGSDAVITVGSGATQRLGVTSSSIRFKEDVEDMDVEDNWTKLRALKPRTFRWNREVAERSSLDYATQTPEPGFIAEEVHEAAPDATMYDWSGDPIVYRDKSMLAMLVKAVQDIDQRLGALE